MKLFQDMRNGLHSGVDPDKVSAPFLPSGLDEERDAGSPILLVGKAPVGPWTRGNGDVQDTYDVTERLSMTRSFLADQFGPKPSNNGSFWNFARDLRRVTHSGETNRSTPIVWSNVAKITIDVKRPANPNPKGKYFDAQYELAIESLKAEVGAFRPKLIVFATADYGWSVIGEAILNGVDGAPKHFPPDEEWHRHRDRTSPAILWIRHPQGARKDYLKRQLATARDLIS